jgi:hypothetical protein
MTIDDVIICVDCIKCFAVVFVNLDAKCPLLLVVSPYTYWTRRDSLRWSWDARSCVSVHLSHFTVALIGRRYVAPYTCIRVDIKVFAPFVLMAFREELWISFLFASDLLLFPQSLNISWCRGALIKNHVDFSIKLRPLSYLTHFPMRRIQKIHLVCRYSQNPSFVPNIRFYSHLIISNANNKPHAT